MFTFLRKKYIIKYKESFGGVDWVNPEKKQALSEKWSILVENVKIKLIKIFGGFNWKLRLKNKLFLCAVASTLITLLIALGLPLPPNSETIVTSILTLFGLAGILNDPTSQSFEDTNAVELKSKKIQNVKEKSMAKRAMKAAKIQAKINKKNYSK